MVVPLLIWTAVLLLRPGQSRDDAVRPAADRAGAGLDAGRRIHRADGDIGRQNTVFKFYIQAWLLFSVVGGAAFAWLISAVDHWRGVLRGAWMFVLVLLVGMASLFPIMAIRGKAVFRFDTNAPLTLDGMDYMNYATQSEGSNDVRAVNMALTTFPLSEDYDMIRWLQDNVQRDADDHGRAERGHAVSLERAHLDLHRAARRARLEFPPEAAAQRRSAARSWWTRDRRTSTPSTRRPASARRGTSCATTT